MKARERISLKPHSFCINTQFKLHLEHLRINSAVNIVQRIKRSSRHHVYGFLIGRVRAASPPVPASAETSLQNKTGLDMLALGLSCDDLNYMNTRKHTQHL